MPWLSHLDCGAQAAEWPTDHGVAVWGRRTDAV